MKISLTALALVVAAPAVMGFTTVKTTSSLSQLSASTMEAPPTREAPGAGWEPEWENRQGLSPEEFMQSDMKKPDLSGMYECPLTRWNTDG